MKNILLVILLFFTLVLTGCNKLTSAVQDVNENKATPEALNTGNQIRNDYPVSSAEQIADKLEVYYFHRTARCYSCKTIGQYVRETMEQKYGKQIKDGLIDFRELNVELPENKEIAIKFQASGSSLYINRIIDNQDNIERDANVWRLLSDEEKFKKYLEDKINRYLGI
jgi:hypothetical protein